MRDPSFRAATPSAKVYYCGLLAKRVFWHFERGVDYFYWSDTEAAAYLKMSLGSVRAARRSLKRKQGSKPGDGGPGLIWYSRGFRDLKAPGHYRATVYNLLEHAEPGALFAQIDCADFMLALHEQALEHRDFLVWLMLLYWRGTHETAMHEKGEVRCRDFFITKRELVELTGLPDAVQRARRMNNQSMILVDSAHKLTVKEVFTYSERFEPERLARLYSDTLNRLAACTRLSVRNSPVL